MFFLKAKNAQTFNFLLVKSIFSDLKITTKYPFNYKRPLFIELKAVELGISFTDS